MKKNSIYISTVIFLLGGLLALPVHADLGLAQTVSEQGVEGVGSAVEAAVASIYAGASDAAEIQNQIVAILNEVEALGNEEAMRYGLVAVMVAGGTENMELGKGAIDSSQLATNHPQLVESTVAATEALMTSGGESGGSESGGNRPTISSILDDLNDEDLDDEDVSATPV